MNTKPLTEQEYTQNLENLLLFMCDAYSNNRDIVINEIPFHDVVQEIGQIEADTSAIEPSALLNEITRRKNEANKPSCYMVRLHEDYSDAIKQELEAANIHVTFVAKLIKSFITIESTQSLKALRENPLFQNVIPETHGELLPVK